jgi:aldehyde:ferredoxin oxidoreductase
MTQGWMGKRLCIDLTLRKAWSEDIPEGDLRKWLGGRGLNASFFEQNFPPSTPPPENSIAFAVGPLTGTLAPCSGWTSIASFSPFYDSPRYAFTRMPGHFGVPLKGAGFDQCIVQGKSERPVYLWIDNGKVRFEEAGHLWGKGTTDTTVAIQEEKGDRNIEVLCIGPAGEKQLPFANVIHRLSWTGDHLGLGYLFGVKNLKAIAVRGKKAVSLHDPRRFLDLCLILKDQIQKDRKLERLRKEGSFSVRDQAFPHSEQQWTASFSTYLSGQESCFACPVHCGRNIDHQENYTGGIHLEKAWHLGPRIGVYDVDWTLKLHHLCHDQGLDPFLTGSILAAVLNGVESGGSWNEDPGETNRIWNRGEQAFRALSRIVNNGKNGFHITTPPSSENRDFDVLADVMPFCKIVVSRFNDATVSNMINLIDAATGYALSVEDLRESVRNILRLEHRLSLPQAGKSQTEEIHQKEEYSNESTDHWTAP